MSDAELQDFIDLARSVTDDDRQRFEPPAALWTKISSAISEEPHLKLASPVDASHEPTVVDTADIAEPATDVIDLSEARTRVAPRTRRMRRRQMLLGAAAAAVALVVGFSFFTGETDQTLVAQATNADLPEPYDGTATATVSGNDEQSLTLAFTAALPEDEPIEIWLIKKDFSDMHSLGLLDDQSASYAVPAGLDLSQYSVVDLSIEPNDGDPTHSGRSILRGELQSL